jgi:phage shock protein PspC (stress-responsive transcriptional regulator)
MKKTVNINLGGTAFIIDENAFEILQNYLEALKRKFSNETERAEILSDIENRLAEMLSQRLGDRKEVVSAEDVESVIAVMGKPEDIGGEEAANESASANSNTSSTNNATSNPGQRRLYRDTEDKVVGGVIAGLCHYFGIGDPVWVRLVVALLVILGAGTPILIYILLLIIVPKAETAAEKLQMKGEPVNISTIEKEIKDAANKAGESISGLFKPNSTADRLAYLFGQILRVTLKVIAVVVVVVCLGLMIGVLAGFFGINSISNMPLSELSGLVVDSTATITLFALGFIMFFAAPLIGIIYLALRFLLKSQQVFKPLLWTLVAVWWAGLFIMIYAGVRTGTGYKYPSTLKVREELAQPKDSVLYVQLVDEDGEKVNMDEEEEDFNIGVVVDGKDIRTKKGYIIGEIHFQLMPAKNDSFVLEKYITSRGKDREDAATNIRYIKYNYKQTDSVLSLPQYIEIGKEGKWRGQNMKVRVVIPEGKKVKFADNMDRVAATVKGDSNYDDTYFANTTWTVEKGRVKCLDCEQQVANQRHGKDQDQDDKEEQEETTKPGKGDF